MADFVTGTPAVVGFTNGNDHRYNYGWDHAGYAYARSVDAGEQTRDILKDVRENALYLREAINSSTVAIEKTGAANSLAIEKIGAASLLATEKTAAATQLAIEKTAAANVLENAKNTATLQLQAALNTANLENQADRNAAAAALAAAQNQAALAAQIAECCCDLKALNLGIESNRVRDQLSLLQTQFLVLTGGGITPAAAGPRNN